LKSSSGTIRDMSTDAIRARLDAIGARSIYAAVALAAVGLVAAALFMQHVIGLNPCPLCIFQRIAYLLLAAAAALAAWRSPRPTARAFGVAAVLLALVGAGIAAWHVRLQNAPETLSCGPGLGVMLENFPLTQVLPKVFRGSGDCADAGMVILGLSLAGWSLVGFLVLTLVTLAAIARR
jgi:disulfide bond formation protein DsbB